MAAADRIYRAFLASTRFFSRGWGPVDTYERLLKISPVIRNREQCAAVLANHLHPVSIKKVQDLPEGTVYDGRFTSPVTSLLPGMLPKESEVARFEMLVPHTWGNATARPMYIQLAGTGDHFFWRRRRLIGLPLITEAKIGSVLLENPFYGSRKPRDQVRSQLHHVSDLFVMGLALILECMLLSQWLEGQGLGPVGLTGISMGGHNASLSASLWPKPVAVVPCLSWSTASCVFTEGVLSRAVNWDTLEEQLFHAKIGYNERLRRAFQRVVEMDDEAIHYFTSTLAELSPYAHSAALLYMNAEDDSREEERERRSEDGAEAHSSSPTSFLRHSKISVKIKAKNFGRKKQKFFPQRETVDVARSVLDFATHLRNYPTPLAPELATFVVAKEDLYVPRHCVQDIRSLWAGCEVRYVNGGHVSSTVLQPTAFRQALIDGMENLQRTLS